MSSLYLVSISSSSVKVPVERGATLAARYPAFSTLDGREVRVVEEPEELARDLLDLLELFFLVSLAVDDSAPGLHEECEDLDFCSELSFVELFLLSALLEECTTPACVVAVDIDLSFVLLVLPSFGLSRLPSVEATAPGVPLRDFRLFSFSLAWSSSLPCLGLRPIQEDDVSSSREEAPRFFSWLPDVMILMLLEVVGIMILKL